MVEITGPAEIAEGFRTTGEMGTEIIEQSLVVETGDMARARFAAAFGDRYVPAGVGSIIDIAE